MSVGAQSPFTLDLRALDPPVGSVREIRMDVPPVELLIGGEPHRVVPEHPAVEVRITRSHSGRHLRLRADAEIAGPCWRCLADARAPLRVDADEFAAAGRDPDAPFDEDMDSEYVSGDRLDLAGWSRDALAEALPTMLLCRTGCAGLCPSCGARIADGRCACDTPAADARWAPLRELADRLGPPEEPAA